MLGKVKAAKGDAGAAAAEFEQSRALANKIQYPQLLSEIGEAEAALKSR